MHVLDAACAQVQVERANHVSYTLRLVKIFRELDQACEHVASLLRVEKGQLNRKSPALMSIDLRSDTEAGKYLSTLSAKSNPAAVVRLATLAASEKSRIKILHLAALARSLGSSSDWTRFQLYSPAFKQRWQMKNGPNSSRHSATLLQQQKQRKQQQKVLRRALCSMV